MPPPFLELGIKPTPKTHFQVRRVLGSSACQHWLCFTCHRLVGTAGLLAGGILCEIRVADDMDNVGS